MLSLPELSAVDYARFGFFVTSSIVAIVAYSMFAYALTYNLRSLVARRFAYLALCVLVVSAVDVALIRIEDQILLDRWLRIQWFGIALLPAAYFLFATAVLQATSIESRYRGPVGLVIAGLCAAVAVSVQFTDWVVASPSSLHQVQGMARGPLFWVFSALFAVALGHSIRDLQLARARCLTRSSRFRINCLLWGFIAPALGSFPYLTVLGVAATEARITIYFLSALGNVALSLLLTLMMLSVAFYGVRLPDRVVRYRLLRFLTRGPFIATLVIIAIQTVPTVERVLGLPRDLVVFSVVTGVIVAGQLGISLSKPLIDYLIYREDNQEVAWFRELDRRLLTSSDIREFMANHLTALCEYLGAPRGFVASVTEGSLVVEATVGFVPNAEGIMSDRAWKELLRSALVHRPDFDLPLETELNDLWIWSLHEPVSPQGKVGLLGIMGVELPTRHDRLTPVQEEALRMMRSKMREALLDRRLQLEVLGGLRHIIPDIDRIQGMRGQTPYLSTEPASARVVMRIRNEPDPEFTAWVRDALRDFWGGPRLTRSPLIQLKVVGSYLEKASGNPHHALRLVLGDAIERMKPSAGTELGHLDSLLHQILEMRFIQGKKVRDIARSLAMSESDLYRKQRIAIEQVVEIIQEMERAEEDRIRPAEADEAAKTQQTPI